MSKDFSAIELTPDNLRVVLEKFNSDLGLYINDDQRWRLGRVLTIIEATIADPEQRKAIKDLVQNEWWGGNIRNSRSDGMTNPHTDLRAICEVFGFELYPQTEGDLLAMPANGGEQGWAVKRYRDTLVTKQ